MTEATYKEMMRALETLCIKYHARTMVASWVEGTERHDVWKAALEALAKARGEMASVAS